MKKLAEELLGVFVALWILVALFVLPWVFLVVGCSGDTESKRTDTPTACRGVTRADLTVEFMREAAIIVETGACTDYADVQDCPALQPALQRHEQRRKEWRQCSQD